MDNILKLLSDTSLGKSVKRGGADSFSDQLSCRYTVGLLSLFAIILTILVYFDEPIGCWCPPQFTASQVDFTNKVCWTSNTYIVRSNETSVTKSVDRMISYYQWITLILSCQAFLFYLPRPIWKILNRKSGFAVNSITDAAIDWRHQTTPEESEKIMKYMIHQMGDFLFTMNRNFWRNNQAKTRLKKFWTVWSHMDGNYLVIAYIAIKLVYLTNSIGQLFLLNAFLGKSYHLYGIDVVQGLIKGKPWSTSDRFPRVTFCEVEIRRFGDAVHKFTIQCALPMNLYYEMMFLIIWFWLVFVSAVTCASLLKWVVTSIFLSLKYNSIRDHLLFGNKVNPDKLPKVEIQDFVRSYLRRDGCFILAMVNKSAGGWAVSDLVAGLWDHHQKNRKRMERLRSLSMSTAPNEIPLDELSKSDSTKPLCLDHSPISYSPYG